MEFLKPEEVKNSSLFDLLKISYESGFHSIQGITRLKLDQGQAIFSPEKIFSHPNSEVFLKVSSSAILRYYSELFSNNATFADRNITGEYAFIFSVKLRECIVGEVFLIQINRSAYIFFKYIIFFFYLI